MKYKRIVAEFIATGLGTGHSPVAPGTVGSAAALIIYWCLPFYGTGNTIAFFITVATLLILGTWASNEVSNPTEPDPKRITIDEWVGVLITVAFLPSTWIWLLSGFLLFRVLDVIKPFWIKNIEKIPGGAGIMLDDVAAGLIGVVILNTAHLLIEL